MLSAKRVNATASLASLSGTASSSSLLLGKRPLTSLSGTSMQSLAQTAAAGAADGDDEDDCDDPFGPPAPSVLPPPSLSTAVLPSVTRSVRLSALGLADDAPLLPAAVSGRTKDADVRNAKRAKYAAHSDAGSIAAMLGAAPRAAAAAESAAAGEAAPLVPVAGAPPVSVVSSASPSLPLSAASASTASSSSSPPTAAVAPSASPSSAFQSCLEDFLSSSVPLSGAQLQRHRRAEKTGSQQTCPRCRAPYLSTTVEDHDRTCAPFPPPLKIKFNSGSKHGGSHSKHSGANNHPLADRIVVQCARGLPGSRLLRFTSAASGEPAHSPEERSIISRALRWLDGVLHGNDEGWSLHHQLQKEAAETAATKAAIAARKKAKRAATAAAAAAAAAETMEDDADSESEDEADVLSEQSQMHAETSLSLPPSSELWLLLSSANELAAAVLIDGPLSSSEQLTNLRTNDKPVELKSTHKQTALASFFGSPAASPSSALPASRAPSADTGAASVATAASSSPTAAAYSPFSSASASPPTSSPSFSSVSSASMASATLRPLLGVSKIVVHGSFRRRVAVTGSNGGSSARRLKGSGPLRLASHVLHSILARHTKQHVHCDCATTALVRAAPSQPTVSAAALVAFSLPTHAGRHFAASFTETKRFAVYDP
jgi:hypothetical protein